MPLKARPGEIFYLVPLDRIKSYKTIRFMSWMLGQKGERYVQRHWEDRPVLDDARWNIKGAPVEVMAALCNRLGADPWFSIPHLADDNYVRQFARTTFALLPPDRKVYIEHSNEVWNGM